MARAGRASGSGAWSGRREAGPGQHARRCGWGLPWRHVLERVRSVLFLRHFTLEIDAYVRFCMFRQGCHVGEFRKRQALRQLGPGLSGVSKLFPRRS